MKSDDQKYCPECGTLIAADAETCPNCGLKQPVYIDEKVVEENTKDKQQKWLTTLLLCWFLGVFGVHRFYTGHTMIGFIQLITLGGCGVWVIIDLVMIIMGKFVDADGNPIVNS